jgi:hypothetical protein
LASFNQEVEQSFVISWFVIYWWILNLNLANIAFKAVDAPVGDRACSLNEKIKSVGV